jgi:hypothetical protein
LLSAYQGFERRVATFYDLPGISHGHLGDITGTIEVPGEPRFSLKNNGKRFTLVLDDGITMLDIVVSLGGISAGPRGLYYGGDSG